jgi:hypothetical protein
MKRLIAVVVFSLAATVMASVATAATIVQASPTGAFDPTKNDFQVWFGGALNGYYLTWDNVRADRTFDPSGHPHRNPKYVPPGGNPAWLAFDSVNPGGGSGNGGSNGGGAVTKAVSLYNLGNNNGGAWDMDFSILFYDPSFTGTISVALMGSKAGVDTYKTIELTADQVQAGYMCTWSINADAGETVAVQVTSDGGETYAAGFFMRGAMVAPEPSTMALLAVSAAGVVLQRRRAR